MLTMALQLVRTDAHRSFAQRMAKLEVYCNLTGITLDEAVREALIDYIDVTVEARISQFDKLIAEA